MHSAGIKTVSSDRVSSHHRVFCLDGFHVQVLLRDSGGAVLQQLVLPVEPAGSLVLAVLPGGSGRQVAALPLGDVGLRAVNRLHVLPERAGVRVALGAARDFTHVRFLWEQIIFSLFIQQQFTTNIVLRQF